MAEMVGHQVGVHWHRRCFPTSPFPRRRQIYLAIRHYHGIVRFLNIPLSKEGAWSVKRENQESGEVRIVVERGGFGELRWQWRLAKECGLSVELGVGFKSAEDAYDAARRRVLDLRTGSEAGRLVGAARR